MEPIEQLPPTDHQTIQETYQLTALNNEYLKKINRSIQIQTIIKATQIVLFIVLVITSYVALGPTLKRALGTYQALIYPTSSEQSQETIRTVTEKLTPQSIHFLKSIEQNLQGR